MNPQESPQKLTLSVIAATARFGWRLVRSPKCPRRVKWLLGGLAVYLMNPVDLIPDFIPVIGLLEDAVIAAFVLRLAVRWIPRELIDELWEGDMTFDEAVQALTHKVRRRKRLRRGSAPKG